MGDYQKVDSFASYKVRVRKNSDNEEIQGMYLDIGSGSTESPVTATNPLPVKDSTVLKTDTFTITQYSDWSETITLEPDVDTLVIAVLCASPPFSNLISVVTALGASATLPPIYNYSGVQMTSALPDWQLEYPGLYWTTVSASLEYLTLSLTNAQADVTLVFEQRKGGIKLPASQSVSIAECVATIPVDISGTMSNGNPVFTTISSPMVPFPFDTVSLSYTDSDVTQVQYIYDGSVQATLTLTYSSPGVLTGITCL